MSGTITLTKKDFVSDQEVRWCPGCGDYSILNAVQITFAKLGLQREKVVMVSGIGCSSRFPYYMNTYGFHTIHGRAPAVATGVKVARPDLQVWVATGDGDALSIGGNHFIHALRRNVSIKIVCFNNRIYGLTKGQYSPTSEHGKITKSTPYGSVDRPVNPISLALAAEATWIGRTVDVYGDHLRKMIERMAEHEGSAFLEVFQNCPIFNDGAFADVSEKAVRDERNIVLEHGKPIVFGKTKNQGLRLVGSKLQTVEIGKDGVTEQDLVVHDETADSEWAYQLSRLEWPQFPVPIGVFRAVKLPTFESQIADQVGQARKKGAGSLEKLIYSGELWDVK